MKEFIELAKTLSQKNISDLAVHNMGYEQCRPGYHYGPRVCPYDIIHFVQKGKGELFINDMTLQVEEDDAFIIPAGKIASYQASSDDPWKYYWIGYLGTSSAQYTAHLISSCKDKYVLRDVEVSEYTALIKEGAALLGVSNTNFLRANSILYQILARLAEAVNTPDRKPLSMHLAEEIRYYLEMKYYEPIKMQQVADRFGIHPNHLTRLFRQQYQVTPKQFVTTLKMQKAMQLLETSDTPISLIAAALGYDDQLAFSRAFHQFAKVSPSVYRENSKQKTGSSNTETLSDYVRYI